MIKTGLAGCPDKSELETIIRHKGFKVTGFCPMGNSGSNLDLTRAGIPVLSKYELLNECDVLIAGRTITEATDLLADAIKRSVPVMLLNPELLNSGLISDLMKLQEESQTIVYVNQAGRAKPLLQACMHQITHPSLFEMRHFLHKPVNVSMPEYNADVLFRMLDALLFLCPLNYQKIRVFRHPQSISGTCLISARIEFDNGSTANIISNDLSEDESFTIEIYKNHHLLKIDLLNNHIVSYHKYNADGEINCKTTEFNTSYGEEFYDELNHFYKSVIQNNFSGEELFCLFRVTELTKKIFAKAGFS
jgi:hypothetical protein